MSIRRYGAGAYLRAAFCGFALLGPLVAAPAWALELGELQQQPAAPGQAYRAMVPVGLSEAERQGYLIVSAYALVPNGAGGSSRVPLTIQRQGGDSDIHLVGGAPLPGGTRVFVTASSGAATATRSYELAGAPAPQQPHPTAAAAPAPAPLSPPPPVAVAAAPEAVPAPAEPVSPDQPPAVEPARPVPPPYDTAPRRGARRDQGLYLRPEVELGYEFGGDKLVEVECVNTNDNSTSTPSLRAGSGLIGGIGGHLRPNRHSPYDLRLMFDYKYQAACASVNLQRFRFTLLPSYWFGPRQRFWAGAGLIYETGIKFDGKNLPVENMPGATLGKVDFDDAVGGTVQLGWWFVALDYNFLKYSKNGDHLNANSVGLLFTYGFDFR
jgi:hypothetical protein